MVVLIKCHFQVEAHEFRHVTVSLRVFGTENGSDFIDSLKVGTNDHLLVELRGLGEVGKVYPMIWSLVSASHIKENTGFANTLEIRQLKDIRPSL